MIFIILGIVLVAGALTFYALDNEIITVEVIENNAKTFDSTEFFEDGKLIAELGFLGQPPAAETTEGVVTQKSLADLDADCKDNGNFYFNITTDQCENIPDNQTGEYLDNSLYTAQGQTFGHGQQSNFNPDGEQQAERSEWITIPNPVYIRGFLKIPHPDTGEILKERFDYRIEVTCEFTINECYRQEGNTFVSRGTTLSSGYFEKIFYPREGFDNPGEYVATLEAFSETLDDRGERIPIEKEYHFFLIDPSVVT